MTRDYRSSLNLPQTDFPMKADLVRREPELLARWQAQDLYQLRLESHANRPRYILHDGPPYANGHIHIGHALNKLLKDFVVKSRAMSGFLPPYVPGWDCHGLPIEHQVLKDLGPKKAGMTKVQIRKLCRAYAEKFIRIQRDEFVRLGVLGDWTHPYLTMDPAYEADIVRELGRVVATGAVYRSKKPVLWCATDETALAEAEVEYENHTSPSIYVKFPWRGPQDESLYQLFHALGIQEQPRTKSLTGRNLSAVIWTTTPWTLVANRAISVHPRFKYVVSLIKGEAFIIAHDLFERFIQETGIGDSEIQNVCTFEGSALEGWEFSHPWLDRPSPIVLGEHVTLEQGTGLVHTAPGHGQEDYEVGQRYGLEVYAPVDGNGRFTADAGPFAGQRVFDANPAIIGILRDRGMLLREQDITHSYPHCWRCKKPVIFRATEQWFISMQTNELRTRALAEIDRSVTWIPKWGRDRIYGMIENRPDWCISRQRAWGVPIVAFACRGCGRELLDPKVFEHVAGLIETAGSDIWFELSAAELLPHGTACGQCGGLDFVALDDILDVWFESGVSHAAVLQRRPELSWPADLYLEGSDQHRGWFHSALLTSLLTNGRAPYRAVLTHGFVVDGAGKKMSKSAGNVVAPQEVIQKYGAEILRLWVAATDFREDIRISPDILVQLAEAYRKIRNTCRFLLGNLYDYDPDRDRPGDDQLEEIDRWIRLRFAQLNRKLQQAYADSEFHSVFHGLNNFCAVDLSAIYLDILKDRLYTLPSASPARRAAQRVLYELVSGLARLMAPILSFTSEEIWSHLPGGAPESSVHLSAFPEIETAEDNLLAERWNRLLFVRGEVAKTLESKRNEKVIGASLDAVVTLSAGGELYDFLESYRERLPEIFIVSEVQLVRTDAASDLRAEVSRAGGLKCARCWRYRDRLGREAEHPELCDRCTAAVVQ